MRVLTRMCAPLPHTHTQALEHNAARVAHSPAMKTQADLLQSQRLLPQAFDLVRAIYGVKGPLRKQREEVRAVRHRVHSLYREGQGWYPPLPGRSGLLQLLPWTLQVASQSSQSRFRQASCTTLARRSWS